VNTTIQITLLNCSYRILFRPLFTSKLNQIKSDSGFTCQQHISWCADICSCLLGPNTAFLETTKDCFAHKKYADCRDEMGGVDSLTDKAELEEDQTME